jgi:hypothetical protein
MFRSQVPDRSEAAPTRHSIGYRIAAESTIADSRLLGGAVSGSLITIGAIANALAFPPPTLERSRAPGGISVKAFWLARAVFGVCGQGGVNA